MSHNHITLLLGTNLGLKKDNLSTAIHHIEKEIGLIEQQSKIIETEAIGFDSENSFLNMTVRLQTNFSPIELLRKVKEIEMKMGRIYLPTEQQFQDRLIDIDILTFNQIKFKSHQLLLPHPQITSRSFINCIMI